MSSYFLHKDLMDAPVKRSAYSDRLSYQMAEMSKLAYFKFEGGCNIDELLESIKKLLSEESHIKEIEDLIKSSVVSDSAATGKKILTKILFTHGFKLLSLYNETSTGAQGFLCVSEEKKIAVLSFRGTEKRLKDIKADVKGSLVETENNNGKFLMHEGYLWQFKSVEKQIEKDLKKAALKDCQLFITGHSLGGALAITATKFLAHDIAGACYTFGSPPVGTEDFDRDIKTPIYRIVNHVDIVPRLPSPFLVLFFRYMALALGILLDLFTSFSPILKKNKLCQKAYKILTEAQKYRQSGYSSYLVGEGKNARLRYTVNFLDKFIWWLKQFKNVFKGEFKIISDHSIDEYSKKLATWAETRK